MSQRRWMSQCNRPIGAAALLGGTSAVWAAVLQPDASRIGQVTLSWLLFVLTVGFVAISARSWTARPDVAAWMLALSPAHVLWIAVPNGNSILASVVSIAVCAVLGIVVVMADVSRKGHERRVIGLSVPTVLWKVVGSAGMIATGWMVGIGALATRRTFLGPGVAPRLTRPGGLSGGVRLRTQFEAGVRAIGIENFVTARRVQLLLDTSNAWFGVVFLTAAFACWYRPRLARLAVGVAACSMIAMAVVDSMVTLLIVGVGSICAAAVGLGRLIDQAAGDRDERDDTTAIVSTAAKAIWDNAVDTRTDETELARG